jgi:hypothetical protein
VLLEDMESHRVVAGSVLNLLESFAELPDQLTDGLTVGLAVFPEDASSAEALLEAAAPTDEFSEIVAEALRADSGGHAPIAVGWSSDS